MKKAALVLLASAAGFAGAAGFHYFSSGNSSRMAFSNSTPVRVVSNLPLYAAENEIGFEKAAEQSVHSVVHIKTQIEQNNLYYNDPWHQFFFGDNGYRRNPQVQMGTGSGVIISPDGYIVTNNHVVANASKVEVTLNNNKTYSAEVVGKDPTTDLALIKINENNLPFIQYGNSDEVKVGQWVLAVGNPFNLTSTVTAGIVSAKGRNINILEGDPSQGMYPIESFIQTDAAVNPGNSGGALVNTRGELVGINSAIASNTGSYAGYSFAVPVNIVRKVVEDLVEFGTVQRAFIGVSIRDIDNQLADEKDIKDFRGVFVSGITDGGAAEQAGLKEGDIILKIGDSEVNNSPELQEQVGKYRPGDKINVTVLRGKEEKLLSIVLKNRNGNTDLVKREKVNALTALGATFEQVNPEEKRRLKINNGIKITRLEKGKLSDSGIREGFIITSVDKKPIQDVNDLSFLENKKGGVLIEGVYPNGFRAYYGFGL